MHALCVNFKVTILRKLGETPKPGRDRKVGMLKVVIIGEGLRAVISLFSHIGFSLIIA